MTAFEACSVSKSIKFSIGKSSVIWESAVYKDKCDKVEISRIVQFGGKKFLLGLGYKTRYISPDTQIKIHHT